MCQGHLESRHACAVIPNTNQLPIDPSLQVLLLLRSSYYDCLKVVEYQKVFSIWLTDTGLVPFFCEDGMKLKKPSEIYILKFDIQSIGVLFLGSL